MYFCGREQRRTCGGACSNVAIVIDSHACESKLVAPAQFIAKSFTIYSLDFIASYFVSANFY